jgi:acylphosphatase
MLIRAILKGEVQDVGFRATAKLHADKLRLTGFVRNLPDGSVELCASGPEKDVELFIEELKHHFTIHETNLQYLENFRVLS